MVSEVYQAERDLEDLAQQTFPADRFIRVPGVCVFAEHETVDSKGQPQRYDRAALEAIIAKCNSRIRETGDFAVLTDGHTPDKDELRAGVKMPTVVGFVGNFRLGRIGRNKKRYAILADEWHFKDAHDALQRRPRRSVEVWMHPQMNERFFDPVAALGAETPRLDLGVKFCRLATGELVEKYQAAFPAEGNVFVKEFAAHKEPKGGWPSDEISSEKAAEILKHGQVQGKPLTKAQKGMFGAAVGRRDYQAPTSEGEGSMLADEDLQQILNAINELDFVKWARDKMAQEGAEETATENEAEYQAEEENGGEVEPAPPPDEALAGEGEAPPEAPPEAAPPTPEEAPPPVPEEEEEEYRRGYAMSRDNDFVRLPKAERQAERARYRKLEGAFETLKKEHYALKTKHGDMVRRACDAARKATIEKLALQYAIDADEEFDRCLYSRGSEMTNKTFEDHVAMIRRLASASPVGRSLPAGKIGAADSDADVEKYNRARQYAEQKRRDGAPVSWAEALEAIEQGNGAK